MRVAIEADGGARGNPGPAGYGAVVRAESGEVLAERLGALGVTTNNVAEYHGLIAGLTAALELGADEADVRMDSKLVVEQMSGRWQIKHPGLRPLAAEAAALAKRFRSVRYSWIPRERNKDADRLANAAMDGSTTPPARTSPEAPTGRVADARPGSNETLIDASKVSPAPAVVAASADVSVAPVAIPDVQASIDMSAAAGVVRSWAPPSTGSPLRMVLVRHGETPFTAEKRYSGRGDVPLSDRGREQAASAAARALAVAPALAAVVTSPLRRCRDTAAAFGDVPIVVDDDLIECDFGAWEGLTFADVRSQFPAELNRWLASTAVAPPGGESFQQVGLRVRRAVRRLQQKHQGEQIAVVSHVTPIKLLLRDALAAGDDFLYRLYLDPAGLSIVDSWPDGGVAVRSVNETAHLAQLSAR